MTHRRSTLPPMNKQSINSQYIEHYFFFVSSIPTQLNRVSALKKIDNSSLLIPSFVRDIFFFPD